MQNNPSMLVMAARGHASFSATQLHALASHADLSVQAVPRRLTHEAMRALCAPAQILGFTRRATLDFNAALIDALPNLRAIAVFATGYDWLDTAALTRRQIKLAMVPDYSTLTVAEHALGLMLSMSRRLHLSDRVARGDLPVGISLRGFELHGKTLGIIGYGRIGRAVARLALAFGMRVVCHDTAPRPVAGGVDPLALADLLAESDIVIVACGHARGAPPLVDAMAISAMRAGALLINVSRSALVDNAAVLAAIIAGQLRGYAVDDTVFDEAQLARVEHGRILQSAHTGWYSDEAMLRGTQMWVDNLVGLACGLGDVGGGVERGVMVPGGL